MDKRLEVSREIGYYMIEDFMPRSDRVTLVFRVRTLEF